MKLKRGLAAAPGEGQLAEGSVCSLMGELPGFNEPGLQSLIKKRKGYLKCVTQSLNSRNLGPRSMAGLILVS